jgi:hypothetical protein
MIIVLIQVLNSSARVDFPVPGVPEMNKINNYKIIREDCA